MCINEESNRSHILTENKIKFCMIVLALMPCLVTEKLQIINGCTIFITLLQFETQCYASQIYISTEVYLLMDLLHNALRGENQNQLLPHGFISTTVVLIAIYKERYVHPASKRLGIDLQKFSIYMINFT